MIFRWFKKRRRRKLLAQPFPPSWESVLEDIPFTLHLSPPDLTRLRDSVRVIVAEKNWEGCGGLELTDEIRVMVAAQAALLILNVPHDYYRKVRSIYVYPSGYRSPDGRPDQHGVVHDHGSVTLGEAWPGGPVVLSWTAVKRGAINPKDGRNLVFHEFAHKLDFLGGSVNGTPVLRSPEAYEVWHRVMTAGYERLLDATENRKPTLLDKYGATNPAEFFAVATECFFERGRQLQNRDEALYGILRDFYGQDTAEWE